MKWKICTKSMIVRRAENVYFMNANEAETICSNQIKKLNQVWMSKVNYREYEISRELSLETMTNLRNVREWTQHVV